MKNIQKGFFAPVLGLIVALVLGGAIYAGRNSNPDANPNANTIENESVGNETQEVQSNLVENESEVVVTTTSANTSNSNVKSESKIESSAVAPAKIQTKQNISVEGQVEKECHPSYSGCLNPNASDYDCAGGSGDGPYYTGPVRVLGSDVFGLDRDGDGMGCDK
jgi:resuscitation-promoting factor RpfB